MATGDYSCTKVDEDDPTRCQAVIKTKGQCRNKAVEGGRYCMSHGGNSMVQAQSKENIRRYRIAKWQSRMNEFADDPGVKSLRDEIAVLRLMLEERLNMCHDSHELVLQSHLISDLVIKIEKLVSSCHRLEGSMGQLLDKQAILQFASSVVEVISKYIEDEQLLNLVADEIISLVGNSDARTSDAAEE